MIRKIKFFPLKRNGEIAKTPIYTSTIDREFCYNVLSFSYEEIRYHYSYKSLYSIYLVLLNSELKLDIEDQMFIDGEKVTTEKFLECIEKSLNVYKESVIIPHIDKFKSEMLGLENLHITSIQKLDYVAFKMNKTVERYKQLNKFVKLLSSNEIVYLVNEDEDNENYHDYRNIVDDIHPVDVYELLRFLTPTQLQSNVII